MTKRIHAVTQHDVTDCGAACLSSVAQHHGLRLPISRIRQLACTDQKGTNVLGMVEAAAALGFNAKGVRGSFDSLARIPLPAVAHVIDHERRLQHYVVVYRVSKTLVVVMDPAGGRVEKLSHDDFRARWTGVLVLLVPNQSFRGRDETTGALRRFWQLVRPHRTVMAQALTGAVVTTLLGLSTAIYVQKIVDYVLIDGNTNLLNLMTVIMVALLATQLFVGAMKSVFTLHTGQLIDAELILGYYIHLLGLPQQFFDTMRVGEITSRFNDAVKIRSFINDVAIDLVVNLLVLLFSLALLYLYNAAMAMLMLAVVPLYAAIYALANHFNRRNGRELMERSSDLQAQLVESLNAVATIKRFGLEWFANVKTETRFLRLLRSVYGAGVAGVLLGSASQMVARLSTIALLWFGARLVVAHQMTPGELMSCYALVGYLTGPVATLIGMNRTVQEAMIAADRLFEIMDLRAGEGETSIELSPELVADIRFEHVAFRYGTRMPVFTDLSLVIPVGQLTAVVGESGSGKSTLASLLQRVYPVSGGHVRIGSIDVAHLGMESLRRTIGVVPQRIDLFAGNVVDNIALGDFEPDMRRVLDVCALLGISEFVERLPHGLQTELGENGASLSGGQRQRIAIARALYKQPRILILDEATSALDSTSEQYVQRAIQRLRAEGRTVIIIAHRLSTVMHADKIVVLKEGTLMEEGTHEELMARERHYFALWQHQFPSLRARAVAA
jgi:ABC-type bacteriocin transporter